MSISVFTHDSKRTRNGYLNVYLRINFKGKRFLVKTELTTSSPLKGTMFPKNERGAQAKKRRLDDILSTTEGVMAANTGLTPRQMKDLIVETLNPGKADPSKSLIYNIRCFAATKKGRTVDLYTQTAKRVEEYDNSVSLDEVDVKWLQGFERKCAETMKVNSVGIHLRNIRAVFNWAIGEEKTQNYPFTRFKIKHEETQKRSLSVEELRLLRDYPCAEYQKPYRDIFMLMFYLIGINAKDLLNLTQKNLVGDRIEYVRAKTKKRYSVKVEPEAMAIIERYKGKKHLIDPLDRFKSHLDWLHHFNDALKAIGKDCRPGVKTTGKALFPNLSSYWSRHTWGTIAAELDTPIDVIAHALGHNIPELKVTSIYIRFNEKKVDEANRKVIDFVNSK